MVGVIGYSIVDAVKAHLLDHLIEASCAAKKAAAKVGDGGSANYDCLGLNFRHTRLTAKFKALVESAVKDAGLRGWWGEGGSGAYGILTERRYFVNPPVEGMGAKRTVAAEAMVEVFKAHGWDVSVLYQTD